MALESREHELRLRQALYMMVTTCAFASTHAHAGARCATSSSLAGVHRLHVWLVHSCIHSFILKSLGQSGPFD